MGRVPYDSTWKKMMRYTETRHCDSLDQLWILEHPDVFTAGRSTRAEHFPRFGDTPVVHTDRGGQITWHGPGQLVVYLLLDLRRRSLGIRDLVETIQRSIIDLLAQWDIEAQGLSGAPGVYVDGKKIASLGLKVRRTSCYHGLSLNVHPDLSAFERINPCGYPDLSVTSLEALNKNISCADCGEALVRKLASYLGYQRILWRHSKTKQTEDALA